MTEDYEETDWTNYEQLGWELKAEGKDIEAIEAFDKGIEYDQKVYYALHGKGECLMNLGRYDEALDAFNAAIDLDPDHAWAYHGLGRVYYFMEYYDIAKDFMNESLARDSESPFPWLWRGKILIELHRYDDALTAFRKASHRATKYRYTHHNMFEEIETSIKKVTDYKDVLEKEIDELKAENAMLREKLESRNNIVVKNESGNVNVGGIQATDDAALIRPTLKVGVEAKPKICSYCGMKIDADSLFCPNCGRKVQ